MHATPPAPKRLATLLGPAFVASIAYVDPGNVGANLSAGAQYGYTLVWVLVSASLMAAVIQYQSAKLGIVTGSSLTTHAQRWVDARARSSAWRWAYGGQAFIMAIATDLAEVVGGALALYLLFGIPLWLGGIIVGVVTILLLRALRTYSEKTFELAVSAFLAIVVLGFLGSLAWAPPHWPSVGAALVPTIPDAAALPLIAAMLGATVMPHAIYLHSSMAIERHRPDGPLTQGLGHLLKAQKLDVGAALLIAGSVNVAMLLLGAETLQGTSGDTIEAAHATFTQTLGGAAAAVFALGLLASGIGSSVVGTHAGARILKELLPRQIPATWRRVITIGPAVVFMLAGVAPTTVLVWSQIVLSFGIALAMVPLALLTRNRDLMGGDADGRGVQVLMTLIAAVVVALNLVMIVLAFAG